MPDSGNYISEWFGHRIYPTVVSSEQSIADQRAQTCPFLTRVKETPQSCIKNVKSKGVCTISSCSNGPRQDWVACPYRVFDPLLIDTVAARLYGESTPARLHAFAAPTLAREDVRGRIIQLLREGKRVLTYFDQKIGGEISLSATSRSPEMAFDVTLVELVLDGECLSLGTFAILEVQTMDFHGSYGLAVSKLRSALELHPEAFPETLQANQWWAGDGIEGPNIANVFKRTFYQMMFKFRFGLHPLCAGTALTIPVSVWDSWKPFLAAPEIVSQSDGTSRLAMPGGPALPDKVPAWIYLFDFDATSPHTPSPMRFVQTIGVTAEALGHYALKAAPEAATERLVSDLGIYPALRRRLEGYWPGLAVE